MCLSLCVYLHGPVPVSSTASLQCTMVVYEETTPGKLPLDHAVAGAKVPLNTLHYGRLQLHHVFVGVQVPLSTLYYTTDGYNYIMWSPALTSRSNKARAKRGRSIGAFGLMFVIVFVLVCMSASVCDDVLRGGSKGQLGQGRDG